jgi:hypothetical protein
MRLGPKTAVNSHRGNGLPRAPKSTQRSRIPSRSWVKVTRSAVCSNGNKADQVSSNRETGAPTADVGRHQRTGARFRRGAHPIPSPHRPRMQGGEAMLRSA